MKHAYLILAHTEFGLLQRLLHAIDDPRNVIFLHIDAKVKSLPELQAEHAPIIMLPERVDAAWGDVSLIEAELALFKAAADYGHFQYYHLLSGVDLPIKSQDHIHQFLQTHQGKEFIGYSTYGYAKEVQRKVGRFHFFPRSFRDDGTLPGRVKAIIRAVGIRLQSMLGWQRHREVGFKKGTQWVTVTDDFVRHMLGKRSEILDMYRHTFCSDEIYKQTLAWHSPFRDRLYSTTHEGKGCLRAINWRDNELHDWAADDLYRLKESDAFFARKFNGRDPAFIHEVLKLSNTDV